MIAPRKALKGAGPPLSFVTDDHVVMVLPTPESPTQVPN